MLRNGEDNAEAILYQMQERKKIQMFKLQSKLEWRLTQGQKGRYN